MSENFDKTVWKGFKALQSLGEQAPVPALATTAKDLHDRLGRPARGGPIVAFIATRGENVAPAEVVEAMDRFLEEVQRLPPKFEQPAFQCLSDFKKATASGTSRLFGGLVLAVCLAERLLRIKVGG